MAVAVALLLGLFVVIGIIEQKSDDENVRPDSTCQRYGEC